MHKEKALSFQKFLHYVKTHKFVSVVAVLVVAGSVYAYARPEPASKYETTEVKRGDVVQEVSVTGRVEADTEAELSFEKGGRVTAVNKKVGDRVERGEIIVRLDASELSALRAQAKANLDYELVRLDEIVRGARAEDIAVSESKVRSAENALSEARLALVDKLTLGVDALQDAIYSNTDPLYENPRTAVPRLKVFISDQQTATALEAERVATGEVLTKTSVNEADLGGSTASVKSALAKTKTFLDNLLIAVSSATPSSAQTQATIDGWKSDVSAARTSISGASTALLAAEEKYRSAERSLKVAQDELALKKAPATPESIAAQKAKIGAVAATVENYDAQIAKTVLVAPFSGVVTKQDAKLGQTVSANSLVVSLISQGAFKITANIPEIDLAKLNVGDAAKVTLDAYGSDVLFPATVSAIDPAETLIEGVATYKVTLHFNEKDERIRSGMTANTDILTEKREGVLFVPYRAVTSRDDKKFVRILVSREPTEKEVTLGLRGSDGSVEILSGLLEGEKVITFETK